MRLRACGLAFGLVFAAIACSPDVDDLSSGPPAACGNGVLDAGEACDDARIVTQTCADLVGPKSTGNVRCTACGFDLRGCLGAPRGGAGGSAGKAGVAGSSGTGGGGAGPGGSTSAGASGTAGASTSGAGGANAGATGGGSAGASGAGSGGTASSGGGGAFSAGTGGGVSGGSGGAASAGSSGGGGTKAGGNAGAVSGGSGGAVSGGSGGTTAGAAGSGGAAPVCVPACGPFLTCQADGACGCGPQSMALGGGCWPLSPSPPASRSTAEVCAARAMGKQELAATELDKTPGMCGPHLPSLARLGDIGNRLAYYRWLVGMPPVAPGLVEGAASRDHAECAAAVARTADPVAGSPCATAGALTALSHSYRYRSSFFLDVIDEYVRDAFPGGPQDSFRLGILRQNVKPFWWGEFAGGVQGGGTCFDLPERIDPTPLGKSIWPPPGRVPVELVGQRWTIAPLIANAVPSVKVVEVGGMKPRLVQATLQDDKHDNGPYAVLTRNEWTPLVGSTYQVALSQGGDVVVSYEFTPIECSP